MVYHSEHWDHTLFGIVDAGAVGAEAIADLSKSGVINDDRLAFLALLDAQVNITSAMASHAASLHQEYLSLRALAQDDLSAFNEGCEEVIALMGRSALSIEQWGEALKNPEIFKRYESAFAKLSAMSRDFAKRNPDNFDGLVKSVLSYTDVIDAARVRGESNILNAAKATESGNNLAPVFNSIIESMRGVFSRTNMDAIVAPIFKPIQRAFKSGGAARKNDDNQLLNRQSNRYWAAVTTAINDGDLSDLDRQIAAFGNPGMAIYGRDEGGTYRLTMMDFALNTALETIIKGGANQVESLINIRAVITFLDGHGVKPNSVSTNTIHAYSVEEVNSLIGRIDSIIDGEDCAESNRQSKMSSRA